MIILMIDDLKNITKLDYNMVRTKILKFEIDLRAERGFEKNEINYMENSRK